MILPRHIMILVDSREQKPFPFPKTIQWSEPGSSPKLIEVRQRSVSLPAGDYLLEETGSCCIVERKGSMNELYQNLITRDRGRALVAFKRLIRQTRKPILALDFPFTQRLYKGETATVLTRLAQLCAEFNLQVLTVGGGKNARTCLADLVVRVLLANYLAPTDTDRDPGCPLLGPIGPGGPNPKGSKS